MMPYLKSLIRTIDLFGKYGISWSYVSEYSSHVADARELTPSGNPNNDVTEQRPLMWGDHLR
jgi:hypothetical protein